MTSLCRFWFFRLLVIVATILIPLAAGAPALAQSLASDPNVDNGTHWYGSYDGGHENISLASGNLSLCIPLVSLKEPNKHSLSIPLCYNSQFQQASVTNQTLGDADVLSYFPWAWAPNTPAGHTTPPLGVGWVLTGAPAYYATAATGGSPVEFMPDGSKYGFASGVDGPDLSGADTWLNLLGAQTLIMKDGTRYALASGGSSSCPAMGCATETYPDGTSATWTNTSVTDAVGRVVAETSNASFSGSSTTAATSYVQFQYPVSSGTATVTVQMQTLQFSCTSSQPIYNGGEVGSPGLYSMPTAILLPNGLTYTFQYDSCGMLRKVTYPTGGYTRYDYQAQAFTYHCLGCGVGSGIPYWVNEVSAKHLCPVPVLEAGATTASAYDSSNQCPVAEQTTTYTPTVYGASALADGTNGGNQQNVVVDPVGNKIVYQFSTADLFTGSIPSVETERQYYAAGATVPMKTVTTQYATTTAPGSTSNDLGAGTNQSPPAVPTVQTTTLDNGMVSQVQWSYDLWPAWQNDSVMTEERIYDYGQGAPGPLLKRTDYQWLHRLNAAAYGWPNSNGGGGRHICDRKTSEIVYDGSGKMLEKTTDVYDGNNGGGPAFLSKETKWRSTDGASLTTSYLYGAYGNVTQKTDPNGNVTTYSYSDNYADGVNRNSNAFLTKTTDALGHVTQNQYYWGSGLVAATCGENFSGTCETGLASGADYASYAYDLMGRKTATTTGDGGKTTHCYSDLGGAGCSVTGYPLETTTTEAISPGVNKVSASIAMHPINGLPATTTQLNSDPSCPGGSVNVDTTYDLDGRKSTVTNPYCTSSPGASTSGATTYAYDGLSRTTRITHPDGAYATNTYTGRAVLSADEGNGTDRVQRISQSDALGRLIYVCEVTGQTQQGSSNNTPSSCGTSPTLDISATGFLTTYGYDASNSNGPLDSLTSVTQGGESRSFVYDSLGELLSATNPESGTTTYRYDSDSNLTGKTDAKGISTAYSYDAVNRLTGKTYSDGITPSATFTYDQSTSANSMGRLSSESTPGTFRSFSYDLMGRVVVDNQGSGSFNYSYDLAGDPISSTNGLSGTSALAFTSQYDSAGRLSTLSGSTLAGSSSSLPLFADASYTPAGQLANALMGQGATPNIDFHRDYNSRLLPIDEIDTLATAPASGITEISGFEQVMAYSYGSVTFSGAEVYESSSLGYQTGTFGFFIYPGSGGPTVYEVSYGQNDTPQTLASNLAAQLTCANGGLVRGVAQGATVYFASCVAGLPSQVTYSDSVQLFGGNYAGPNLPPPAFSAATSSAAMIFALPQGATTLTFSGAEQNNQTGTILTQISPDGGGLQTEVTLTWGAASTVAQGTFAISSSAPSTVTQTLNGASTPASLAQAFAAVFPSCAVPGTEVTAVASGPSVTLISCYAAGQTVPYSLTSGITGFTGQTGGAAPAFALETSGSIPVPSALNLPAPVFDSGTVTLTADGVPVATTNYGAGSDATSVVAGLIGNGQNNGVVGLQFADSCNICLVMTADGNGATGDYSYSVTTTHAAAFSGPSFAAFPNPGTLSGGGGSAPLYNWSIASYAPNGDVLGMTDAVMGSWSYSYDDFNRLTGGTATAGADSGLNMGWTYDRYGNRWAQNASCSGANCAGVTAAQPQLTFGNNNQVANWVYDADGNLLYDGRNAYNYDAEGRLIALNGEPTYVYDAEGRRVAKLSPSGAVTASYLLDLAGHQVTELNGAGTWMHSNVWAPGGRLLATYEGPGEPKPGTYHFHLTDWLGTERMQTNAAGNSEETCASYPFGDGLNCTGPAADATEQHFTGKERDPESGLDYFYARYYSSTLGRFMTPDWAAAPTAVPYATFGDPQTLNLYAYVNNNPNTGIDMDGHATIQGEGGGGSDQQSAENQAAAVAAAGADDSAGDKDNSADSSSSKTGANGSSGKSKAGSTGKAPTAAKPKTPDTKPGQGQQPSGQNDHSCFPSTAESAIQTVITMATPLAAPLTSTATGVCNVQGTSVLDAVKAAAAIAATPFTCQTTRALGTPAGVVALAAASAPVKWIPSPVLLTAWAYTGYVGVANATFCKQ